MFKSKPQSDVEMFTIYDSKTQSYGVPTFAINQHDLIRQIVNMFQQPEQKNNLLLTNAEDYSIFKIGSYDKKTGTIQSLNQEHVANLNDLRTMIQLRAKPADTVPAALYPT